MINLPKHLVITRESNANFKTAKIDVETHAVLNGLSIETGVSITRLISQFVNFGIERVVIVDKDSKERR